MSSLLLFLAKSFNAACGFFFWMVAARYYRIEDLGLSTALFSYVGLVVAFSRLGFDFSLIRFSPNGDREKVINTALNITTIATLVLGLIFISGVNIIAPSLSSLQNPNYFIVFLLFASVNSMTLMIGIALIATRRSNFYFLQNIILALRIPLLIPLAFLGFYGIFTAATLAYIFGSLFLLICLNKQMPLKLTIDKQFIKKSFSFSAGNYISNILFTLPTLILPIMIINLLGEIESAKCYIALTIANLVLMIPDSLSTSLFVEGCYGENLRKNVIKAGVAIYLILIPAIIFMYFLGDYVLHYFGKDYLDALDLLRLLILSSVFTVPHYLFIPIQNIRMNVESIIKINLIRSLLLLGSSYILVARFGILGVGFAWIIANVLLSLAIAAIIKKQGWI